MVSFVPSVTLPIEYIAQRRTATFVYIYAIDIVDMPARCTDNVLYVGTEICTVPMQSCYPDQPNVPGR